MAEFRDPNACVGSIHQRIRAGLQFRHVRKPGIDCIGSGAAAGDFRRWYSVCLSRSFVSTAWCRAVVEYCGDTFGRAQVGGSDGICLYSPERSVPAAP